MPKVTVVPEDSLIIVDGEALNFAFDAPVNLHALQWDGERGHKEFTDKDNESLGADSYDAEVAPYVMLWQAEKQRLDDLWAEQEAEANTLPNVKAAKLEQIQRAAEDALAPLSAEYPYKEVLSFASQEAEARAVLKDPSSSTPLLTPMASRRGITVEDLAKRIVAKADVATSATGDVLGQAQRDRDRLAAAQTIEEVKAIVPSYTLPEVRK